MLMLFLEQACGR